MDADRTPSIDEFRPAVLAVLADGNTYSFKELCGAAADHLGLDQDVRAELTPSGQPRYINRTTWACSSFVKAGLAERPKRGHYRITANGRVVADRDLDRYSVKDMVEWPQWVAYTDEVEARKASDSARASVGVAPSTLPVCASNGDEDTATDAVEAMTVAEQSYNADVETELRKRLQESSPQFFEKAVIELLWAMGYGGAHGQKRHVGRSGDGGIDGIIRQDALGLTNVYIQAKRYADSHKVGDPEIRNFMGSLDSHGANLGVFITSSDFQPKAAQSAAHYRHGKIVLINGVELTRLMLAYRVAVYKSREFTLYQIDEDFFDEEQD